MYADQYRRLRKNKQEAFDLPDTARASCGVIGARAFRFSSARRTLPLTPFLLLMPRLYHSSATRASVTTQAMPPAGACLLCASGPSHHGANAPASVPPSFVWTRMQAEAGQPLERILRRKELERRAGGGIFFWGIGSALGNGLRSLLAGGYSPRVVFSVMRSRPKMQDVAPDAVLVWTSYETPSGELCLIPEQALVLSRATTPTGDKRRHYALVCQSDEPLHLRQIGSLDASHLRNIGESASRVGSSQVTAVVTHTTMLDGSTDARQLSDSSGPAYEVNLLATLAQPHFVRLANPRLVPRELLELVSEMPAQAQSVPDWLTLCRLIRSTAVPVHRESAFGIGTLFGRET